MRIQVMGFRCWRILHCFLYDFCAARDLERSVAHDMIVSSHMAATSLKSNRWLRAAKTYPTIRMPACLSKARMSGAGASPRLQSYPVANVASQRLASLGRDPLCNCDGRDPTRLRAQNFAALLPTCSPEADLGSLWNPCHSSFWYQVLTFLFHASLLAHGNRFLPYTLYLPFHSSGRKGSCLNIAIRFTFRA